MTKAAKIFAVLAALECFGIMVLEMFYWEKAGMNVDPALSAEFLTQTVSMAANQGLYNGFLGLGIIVGMIGRNKVLMLFSIFCVILAAIYGAYSLDIAIKLKKVKKSKQGIIPIIAFFLNLTAKEKRKSNSTLHFK